MAGGSDREREVRKVLGEQFAEEVVYKEGELGIIEEKIGLTKLMLQRLRLGILAQQYGVAGLCSSGLDFSVETVGFQGSWEAFEQDFLTDRKSGADCEESAISSQNCSAVSSVVGGSTASSQPGTRESSVCSECSSPPGCAPDGEDGDPFPVAVKQEPLDDYPECGKDLSPPPSDHETHSLVACDVSRFYTKKRIIVGNTSQYISPLQHTPSDRSTHKWMVYVRGPSLEADISPFVKSVRFFLHPSYHPNDIIFISKPPFHLTRLGWGEFPVRVQLEFSDKRNKPVDIIHNLVLDRTHTGQQTLGAETIVDIDIVGHGQSQSSTVFNGPLVNGYTERDCYKTALRRADNDRLILTKPEKEEVCDSQLDNEVCPQSIYGSAESLDSSSERPETPKQPLIIRHISLPSTNPSDIVLLDHDYHANVVVNRTPKRQHCTEEAPDTDVLSVKNEARPLVLTTNLDKCLHSAVQATPLWGAPGEDFLLTAHSPSEFRGWNVGRRRAAEWMRAVVVKRLVQRKLKISLLSTKQVVRWCRKNGYTPLDQAVRGGPGFCTLCGCQLQCVEESECEPETECHGNCAEIIDPEEGRRLSTLSTPFELFADVFSVQEEQDRMEERQREDQEVDIMTVALPHSRTTEQVPRFRVPQTPELKWVQQTAAVIGIPIFPAVIDRMYAHVVEHMIFSACSRFMRAILTQAVQESGRGVEGEGSRERVLVPLHLYRAIQNLEFCDFLTNKHMGLPPPPYSED